MFRFGKDRFILNTTKIVQINTTCGTGSTGKIAVSISELFTQKGLENRILFSCGTNGYELGIPCGSRRYTKMQAVKSRVLGNYGFNSKVETKKMIAEIDKFSPNVVLLHNIHGHDCNLEMLFSYFKQKHTKLIWVFHDCWAFTSYCTHFTFNKCDRWKTGCAHCPQRKQYSWFLDRSKELYQKKKQLFSGLNLTIVAPSQWLADLVKQSFLKEYPVKVIHNGIDLSVFKPSPSNFRKKYNIPVEKFILLGVAFGWGERKGLDTFIELSKRLDPEVYQIVLVGTDDSVDKLLPSPILSIHRTQNQKELAEIYTAADLFVNPTREDNYPTVNMESIACGTPVLTFNTGGSAESAGMIDAMIVKTNTLKETLEKILSFDISEVERMKYDALRESFSDRICYEQYCKLL